MTSEEKWTFVRQLHDVVFSYNYNGLFFRNISIETIDSKESKEKEPGQCLITLTTINPQNVENFKEYLKNDMVKYKELIGYPIEFKSYILIRNETVPLAGYTGSISIGETSEHKLSRITSSNMRDTKVGSIQKICKESLLEMLIRQEREREILNINT
jgi:hypothetical protein